ncbi:MAG: oligosaccharide flippase family protein [Bacteroidota bacterium]|nr:oligosaccharide flippase family protein [Bacteroidota bacterium]
MEFGRHISKGLWAFADKALPAFYGIGYIFLVIRVLPQNEFGAFIIIQTIFVVVSTMSFSLALQPLIKYGAEPGSKSPYIAISLMFSAIVYIFATFVVIFGKHFLSSLLDPHGQANLPMLLNYIPMLFLSALYRSFAVSLLQITYDIKKIFWIDAVYFLGTLILILFLQMSDKFKTAEDLIILNIIGQGLSSLLALFLTFKMISIRFHMDQTSLWKMLNYGKYIFGGNSVYTMFTQADIFFISSFVGISGVAVYGAAKIFTRIFDVLGQVLQMFLIPYSSKTFSSGEMDSMRVTAEKTICFSTILFLPIFFVLLIFPEKILYILYSGKYTNAASLLMVFSFLALIAPWNGVSTSYLLGMGKAKEGFYLGLVFIALTSLLYVTLTPTLGVLGTTLAFVISYLISTILYVKYLDRFIPLNIISVINRVKDANQFLRKKLDILFFNKQS